jgi:hypothetical protein
MRTFLMPKPLTSKWTASTVYRHVAGTGMPLWALLNVPAKRVMPDAAGESTILTI